MMTSLQILFSVLQKPVYEVIWQKAASPFCNPSLPLKCCFLRSLNPIYGSLDQHESVPQTASRSIESFCTANSCAQHTDRLTDTQTTLRATSTAIGRIYALRQAIWPKKVPGRSISAVFLTHPGQESDF